MERLHIGAMEAIKDRLLVFVSVVNPFLLTGSRAWATCISEAIDQAALNLPRLKGNRPTLG